MGVHAEGALSPVLLLVPHQQLRQWDRSRWLVPCCSLLQQMPWLCWQQLKDLHYGYSISKMCVRIPALSGGINITWLSLRFVFLEQLLPFPQLRAVGSPGT